jgi:hypothetical protein
MDILGQKEGFVIFSFLWSYLRKNEENKNYTILVTSTSQHLEAPLILSFFILRHGGGEQYRYAKHCFLRSKKGAMQLNSSAGIYTELANSLYLQRVYKLWKCTREHLWKKAIFPLHRNFKFSSESDEIFFT